MRPLLETVTLQLTVRSPVHIGVGTHQLTPLEAVLHRGHVYKVSDQRLAAALQARRLLDDFVLRVGRDGAQFALGAYLQQKGLLEQEFLNSVSEFRTRAPLDRSSPTTFRPCVRGALGRAYLPGSAIKGALRTLWLRERTKPEPDRQRLEEAVIQQIDQRAKPKWFASQLVGPWTQGRFGGVWTSASGIHREWFRALKVADVEYDGETQIYPVRILSLRRGDEEFYTKDEVLLECIPPGTVMRCRLSLDVALLRYFQGSPPFASLREMLAMAHESAQSVLDYEHGFFHGLSGAEDLYDFYQRTDGNLRLGQGSGLHSTTLLLNLSEETRMRLRDQVLRARRESGFFPKSRRVVMEKERPSAPLGWIRWEVAVPATVSR